MTQNRRKHNRKRVSEYFIVVDQRTNRKIGGIYDLSADGMMIITQYRVDIPLICDCRVELPTNVFGHDRLELCIEARWSRKNTVTGLYEAGFKFIHLTDQQKELIQILLNRWTVEDAEIDYPRIFIPDPE